MHIYIYTLYIYTHTYTHTYTNTCMQYIYIHSAWQPRNLIPDCWIDVPVEAQHEMPGCAGIAWSI